ncbi:MAG: FAD-binding oxidoreductase [Gammaproteobacteria bacterium]|nr:FAD-binding oxidoreductase [Gammaproteobacteria bacterium]
MSSEANAAMSGAVERIREIVGERGRISEPDRLEPYLVEWRGLYRGATPLLVRPADTSEVAAVVAICAETGIGLVPQGGNTGLCGGAIPSPGGDQIVLSLERMTRVRDIDAANFTMTVDAGCVLADVQRAAADEDRYFPLSLAAEGSCRIGGNISTNAGGINVLRYGVMRHLVLGLEVVLPDGRIWNGLRTLRKNTFGYDLKQLFIGAEGTLGIITGAVLELFPPPRSIATAWLALRDLDACVELLAAARDAAGDMLVAFELMPGTGLEFVLEHIPQTRDPLARPHIWYALLELAGSGTGDSAQQKIEAVLEGAMANGIVVDGVIATSGVQRAELWKLRESMSEAQKKQGASIKHDIAVPVAALPEFMRAATDAVEARLPGIRVVAFGHAGDGNVHFNLSQPPGMDRIAFLERWQEFNRIVHDIVIGFGGSISAEHGVGLLKRHELAHYAHPLELELMRRLKQALDPQGIMNPGKVL